MCRLSLMETLHRLTRPLLALAGLALLAPLASAQDAPAAPTGLSCVAESNQIRLSWDAVTDATGYNVYRATGSGSFVLLTSTTDPSHNDTTVAPGQTYRYVVTSLAGDDESAPSAECTASAVPFFPSVLAAAGVTGVVVVAAAWFLRRR